MRISSALPHGVSALLGDSARQRRRLEAALAERLQAAGFEEAVLPIVDYLEPYEPLLTPAARRELYQFVDRDGELLALRADFTPMLARLIAPRVASLRFPLRVYYRGDVVRFQEERPGRLREFYQLGAELVGEAGEAAEQGMLRLFLELVTSGYDGPLDVVLGFAGALDRVLDRALDRLVEEAPQPPGAASGGRAARRRDLAAALLRRDREALRRAGAPVLIEVADRGVPDDAGELGPPGDRLPGLLELARRLGGEFPGVRIAVDLAEFATLSLSDPADPEAGDGADAALGGRPYYDGLVFRAYLGASAQPVGGGGRYDRLFRALGAEVPAVGFSVGLDRLARALEASARPGDAP